MTKMIEFFVKRMTKYERKTTYEQSRKTKYLVNVLTEEDRMQSKPNIELDEGQP